MTNFIWLALIIPIALLITILWDATNITQPKEDTNEDTDGKR